MDVTWQDIRYEYAAALGASVGAFAYLNLPHVVMWGYIVSGLAGAGQACALLWAIKVSRR